jgi:hemerythrin
MDYFGWHSKMETGIEIIDNQHKEIAMYINGVFHAVSLRLPHEEQASMRELVESVRSHLGFEEELLEASGYPDLDKHRRSHDEMRHRLERYFSAFLDGSDVSLAMIADLRMWLTTHIRYDDAEFAPHLLRQLAPVANQRRAVLPLRRLFSRNNNSQRAL